MAHLIFSMFSPTHLEMALDTPDLVWHMIIMEVMDMALHPLPT